MFPTNNIIPEQMLQAKMDFDHYIFKTLYFKMFLDFIEVADAERVNSQLTKIYAFPRIK